MRRGHVSILFLVLAMSALTSGSASAADQALLTQAQALFKGRFDVTKDPADTYVFKVPSLRNVARTPPYFHDGSVATLPEAVRVMVRVQLGRTLTDEQVTRMVTFLESLTGTLPTSLTEVPELPPMAFHPSEKK